MDWNHLNQPCNQHEPSPQNKTVGIIGAGRIGAAYARMMVEGHKMNLVYYDPYPNKQLEEYIRYGRDRCRTVRQDRVGWELAVWGHAQGSATEQNMGHCALGEAGAPQLHGGRCLFCSRRLSDRRMDNSDRWLGLGHICVPKRCWLVR